MGRAEHGKGFSGLSFIRTPTQTRLRDLRTRLSVLRITSREQIVQEIAQRAASSSSSSFFNNRRVSFFVRLQAAAAAAMSIHIIYNIHAHKAVHIYIDIIVI